MHCAYGDCCKPTIEIEFIDAEGFSDGASFYYVRDYCSLKCLALDFRRAVLDTRRFADRRTPEDIAASFVSEFRFTERSETNDTATSHVAL
jgi:hypothetical protein